MELTQASAFVSLLPSSFTRDANPHGFWRASSSSSSDCISLTRDTRIETLCENGDLSGAMLLLRDSPPHRRRKESLGALLQVCGDRRELEMGRQVHEIMAAEGFMGDSVLTTRLLTMYSICGSPGDSRAVFETLEDRNIFHWNALISGFSRNELWEEALEAYRRMISDDAILPDDYTLPCVLRACAGLAGGEEGKQIHGAAVKIGLDGDTFVCNSLISMYARCRRIDDALQMFDVMPQRNLVSWNTMLRGLADGGFAGEFLHLFRNLLLGEEALQPDDATLISVLQVCASEGLIEVGRTIHGLALKCRLLHLARVSNSLLHMYCKCESFSEADALFRELQHRNKVTWNTMIGGLARSGEALKTLALLREMAASGEPVDEITILNASAACSNPAMIETLKELHGFAVRNSLSSSELLFNALIAAYCKCGSSVAAEKLFFSSSSCSSAMATKTVSSWNALIGGHAQNDDPQKALDLHLQMISSGLRPDKFSIGSILSACARRRDLRSGRPVHGFVFKNLLQDDEFIMVSLLSLYAQCGEIPAAEIIFNEMAEKNSVAWNAMISGMAQNRLPGGALCYFRRMVAERRRPSAIAAVAAFSAASQLSALKLGQELHCYCLKSDLCGNGGDSFVCSSTVDMYAKSGAIDDARRFFDGMKKKDLVMWNVMIMAYGIHGRGAEAVELLKMMSHEGIAPDSCTFVGVLAACSHAGLVELGLQLFDEMKTKHSLEPKVEHLACMADMLGRAGRVEEAAAMAPEPDERLLSSLLGSCRIHGKLQAGEKIAEKLMAAEPEKAEHYVMASNLFAAAGRWDEVRRLRKTMKEMGLRKEAGCSWIHVDGKIFEFVAGDF